MQNADSIKIASTREKKDVNQIIFLRKQDFRPVD